MTRVIEGTVSVSWRSMLWPAAVFVAVLALALGAFSVTRQAAANEEGRLLGQRRAEVEALLAVTASGIESSLRALGALATMPDDEGLEVFTRAATDATTGTTTAIGALAPETGGFRVIAGTAGLVVDDVASRDLTALAMRALETEDFVGGHVVVGGDRQLAFAVPVGDRVVVEVLAIDSSALVAADEGSPYRDVRVALYASPEPDPGRVVLTTEDQLPMTGDVSRAPFAMGADQWLLSVAARDSLAGSMSDDASWVLLGGGVITAAMAAAVILTLARRRSYALALVDSRTADLRAAQEAAEQANRAKSEFLSRMSHELRTPLNAVLGFGQLLEFEDLTEQQRDAVAHIRKGGGHLLELINEVLDISRIESGNLALSPEPVQVGEMVADTVDLIRPLASNRGIEVVVDRSGVWHGFVLADRQRAKQVMLNLLSNAVKYNRPRGTVAVQCSSDEERGVICVAVTDTGPGIRPEDLDLVFLPFERLGAEHSDVEGTGIGLALSLRLAEAMGGSLTVESAWRRGSTFTLELPAVEGPLERYDRLNHADQQPRSATEGATDTTTVLHIEDNLSNLTLVERIMEQRSGVQVVAAMQGRLGVELAREHQPKLILLDLHLPDMNGEEVLQLLRDDPSTTSVPVVIVSADATPGQVQRLLSVGAAAYLTKPIDVPDLLRLVDDAIERS